MIEPNIIAIRDHVYFDKFPCSLVMLIFAILVRSKSKHSLADFLTPEGDGKRSPRYNGSCIVTPQQHCKKSGKLFTNLRIMY